MRFTQPKISQSAISLSLIGLLASAAGLAMSACQWRPEAADDETGALTISTLGLDDEAEVRVRFYHTDDDVGRFIEADPGTGEVAYEGELPDPTEIGGRTEFTFEAGGTEGNITVTSIPANTPLDVIIERLGPHNTRLNSLFAESDGQLDYDRDAMFMTHAAVGQDSVEVAVGETIRQELELGLTALSTVDVLVDDLPLEIAFVELVAVPSDNALDLSALDGTDPTLADLNDWYENEVRGRTDVTVIRPRLTEEEPREDVVIQFNDPVIAPLDAVLPKRRMQLLVTDYGGERLAGAAFGDNELATPLFAISSPFTVQPGEQHTIDLTRYTIFS